MNRIGFLIMVVVIMTVMDLYVYQGVKSVTSTWNTKSASAAKLGFWALYVFNIAGFLWMVTKGSRMHPTVANRFVGAFIIMQYLVKILPIVFLIIDDMVRLVQYFVKNDEPKLSLNQISRKGFLVRSGLLAGAGLFSMFAYGVGKGAHHYKVRKLNVKLPNLPQEFEGLKMVQISDIHSGSFWSKSAVERGVKIINDLKADIVVFTGDLVNNTADEMDDYKDVFSKISATKGVYSILGNHDYGDYVDWPSSQAKLDNLAALKKVHGELGWKLLLDEHILFGTPGNQLALIGIENWGAKGSFPKYGDLGKAYKGTESAKVKILLSHDPSHWRAQVIEDFKDIDLTLSGHTHGMQFGLETEGFKWSPIKYMYPEWAGLYHQNNQQLYVNRGFGYLGYPGRFGIRPEITELTFVTS